MFNLSSTLGMLQGRSRLFLQALGFVDPKQLNAKAFDQLQARLFRLGFVEAVSAKGFASSRRKRFASACDVQVVISKTPVAVLEGEIKRIFLEINLRYGTTMLPALMNRRSNGSGMKVRP